MATRRTFTPEEAVRKYESLPPDIKKYVYSGETTDAIRKAGEKFKIHLDQLAKLEGEVSFVMLGFTEPKDFKNVLEERLGVDAATASGIAQDLDANLFQKIREHLKSMHAGDALISSEGKGAAQPRPEAQKQAPPISRAAPQAAAPSLKPSSPTVPPATPRPLGAAPMQPPAPVQKPAAPINLPTGPGPGGQPVPKVTIDEKKSPGVPLDPFGGPTVAKEEKIDVGVPGAKPQGNYRVDPYRELPE